MKNIGVKNHIPLWFQICYAIWQFIRSAKLFKFAYGIPYHLLLYWQRKVTFMPFSKISIGVIKPGEKFPFPLKLEEDNLSKHPEVLSKVQIQRGGGLVTASVSRDPRTVGDFGNFHYIIPESKDYLLAELLYHKPDVLTLSADYITESLCIVNYDNQETLLETLLRPEYYIDQGNRRVLLYPAEDSSLNQNFIRILSIMPLVLVSRGMPTASTWFTVGLIVVDLFLNAILQSVFRKVQSGLVFAFRGLLTRVPNRRNRYSLSLFLSSVSDSMNICDTLAGNFYDVEEGSLALLNNFAHRDYCEAVEGAEFGESKLSEKPADEMVVQEFEKETGYRFDYPHYVEVETRGGKIFMGFNLHDGSVCVFPVNRAINFHGIGVPPGGVEALLKVLSFINDQKSNILDIGRDGYAHALSIGDLLACKRPGPAEIRSLRVVKITKKITVAGSSVNFATRSSC